MIGLKRGTVQLCSHEKEWEEEAQKTICRLRNILGGAAKDIQHVGSTAIPAIRAKPIIDIAVAVDRFDDILALEPQLKSQGFYHRPKAEISGQRLWACGSYYDGTGDRQTHFIHIVPAESRAWINYINFRDYLNEKPDIAKEYEALKMALAATATIDQGRAQYLKGKRGFIEEILRKAFADSFLGKKVMVKVDRPIGSAHPNHPELIYPINYGLIPGIPGGDGEEQDVYILGVDHPVSEFTGRIVAIVHRENDAQDKLVAAPGAVCYSREEIERAVYFQEKYFQTRSKCCGENSTSPASVLFFDRSQIADSWLKFAVIAAKHRGKWIFCRHRQRSTVKSLGALPPEMEIAEIRLFDTLPQNLTYPAIQPDLFKKVAGL